MERATASAARRARAQAPVLRLLPRDRQRSGAQARYTRKPSHEVGAAAGTWEHGLAPKKGGLSLVQCHSTGHGVTAAGAVRGARLRQPSVLRLLTRERQRQWRIRATRSSRLAKWTSQLARGSTALHQRRAASRWCSALPQGMERPQPAQFVARARGKRPYCASSPERHRALAHKRDYTRKPAHEVNAAAGTWEHGLPPNKGSLSLGQCPSIGHGATPASAVRARARGKRTCCASSPETASAVAHKRAARASGVRRRSRLARGSTALHRTRAASRSCSARSSGMERPQPARRGARARQASVVCLLPREKPAIVAHKRATRASRLMK